MPVVLALLWLVLHRFVSARIERVRQRVTYPLLGYAKPLAAPAPRRLAGAVLGTAGGALMPVLLLSGWLDGRELLEETGCVQVEKSFVGKVPRTVYRLTARGRDASGGTGRTCGGCPPPLASVASRKSCKRLAAERRPRGGAHCGPLARRRGSALGMTGEAQTAASVKCGSRTFVPGAAQKVRVS